MWVNLHKSSSDIFLYITYSVSVREDKKAMSSKFITKGPIVVLGGAWVGGCCVLVRLTPSAFSNLT